MTPGRDDAERQQLNRRYGELNQRLSAAPPDEREAILEEMDEIARQLRELDLDDRIQSSMEGGSE